MRQYVPEYLEDMCEYCLEKKILPQFSSLPFNDEEFKIIRKFFHDKHPDIELAFLFLSGRYSEGIQLEPYLQRKIKNDNAKGKFINGLIDGLMKSTPDFTFKYPHLFKEE
jgi:hypothetical protein